MGIWKILDEKEGRFKVENLRRKGLFYFPLTNTQGKILSSISPLLSGDIKNSAGFFLTYPATIFDLKNPFCIRTVWLCFNKKNALNISCFWPTQDKMWVEAGPLYHLFFRENKKFGLFIKVLNFIPEGFGCEVMQIEIKNLSSSPKEFSPITSIPIFCRPQDNLRDHRHVTSLLNRIELERQGFIFKPTMIFDERGHRRNHLSYFVFSFDSRFTMPERFFPTLESFCGQGSLFFPEAVFSDKTYFFQKDEIQGKECFAGFGFKRVRLKPAESWSLFIIMGIAESRKEIKETFFLLNRPSKINKAFSKSKMAWRDIFNRFRIKSSEPEFDFWIRWVGLQPYLRKLFGCSFLPHFDYGKGGRGWRDLWQDLLGILIFEPSKVTPLLINNFSGIRIDGSNATIITKDGRFISDRNRISRVWMDHGVWPYFTSRLYIEETGYLDFLFKEVPYYRDHQLKRASEIDFNFKNKDNFLRDRKGKVYKASILEHLLLQNLVQFFNVGKHNNIRLENADWNDGLDMAFNNGESVAFSFMYASNLKGLAELLNFLKEKRNLKYIELTEEILILLDRLGEGLDYDSYISKRRLLERYLELTKSGVSGRKKKVSLNRIVKDLQEKSRWLYEHIRKKEWVEELGIFRGYYDEDSRPVEGRFRNLVKVSLTPQVFSIMSDGASSSQISCILKTLERYLKDEKYYLFRLNTDFGGLQMKLGRAFGFSYGEKENGSLFSHMNVMLAFGLYRRGFVREGFRLINSLFKISTHTESKTYPNLPEYFNLKREGLYSYLTGSASWFIFLFITEVMGIKGRNEDLVIEPKLIREQFLKGEKLNFNLFYRGRRLHIIYYNHFKKSWPDYILERVLINKKPFPANSSRFILKKANFSRVFNQKKNLVEIFLA